MVVFLKVLRIILNDTAAGPQGPKKKMGSQGQSGAAGLIFTLKGIKQHEIYSPGFCDNNILSDWRFEIRDPKLIMMQGYKSYPDVLINLFEANKYENIVDSNFLNAYIPSDFPIPRIEDLRQQEGPNGGKRWHPGYIKSTEINQIFNYIGFIKRIHSREYAQYLPMLFRELKRFIRVIEEVIYAPFISISEDIYVELDRGLQNFFDAYHSRTCDRDSWVEEIWKKQKLFLEHIGVVCIPLQNSSHW